MAANLNVFKTSKKDCILSKSNFSFAEVHWVIYKNFDDMGTLRVGPQGRASLYKTLWSTPWATSVPSSTFKSQHWFLLMLVTIDLSKDFHNNRQPGGYSP